MRTVLRRYCPCFINGVIINACIRIIYSIALPSLISLFRDNNLVFSPVLFEVSVCLRLPEINQYALIYRNSIKFSKLHFQSYNLIRQQEATRPCGHLRTITLRLSVSFLHFKLQFEFLTVI